MYRTPQSFVYAQEEARALDARHHMPNMGLRARHEVGALLGTDPRAAEYMDMAARQLCYASKRSRKRPLYGLWRPRVAAAAYGNLSCGFEIQRYNCGRQQLEFVPEAGNCRLEEPTAVGASASRLADRRIVVVGDSLAYQVFASLSCLLVSSAASATTQPKALTSEVYWLPCSMVVAPSPQTVSAQKSIGAPTRCSERPRCVECGPHSYAANATLTLPNGGAIMYRHATWLTHGGADAVGGYQPRQGDVVVIEAGVHGKPQHVIDEALGVSKMVLDRQHGVHGAATIWMETPTQHFPAVTAAQKILAGSYQARFSSSSSGTSTPGSGSGCLPYLTRNERSELEWAALHNTSSSSSSSSSESDVFERLHGVLSLTGMHMLGASKVGRDALDISPGATLDCTHFCLPGPTDELARALFSMIR